MSVVAHNDAVSPKQRFTRRFPCPVCGGGADLPSGQGVRCYGFLSGDGRFAHCTREEHAGGIAPGKDEAFAHRLDGPCRCGQTHGEAPPPSPTALRANGHSAAPSPRKTNERRWQIRNQSGTVEAVHVRLDFDDGSRKFFWERPDGTSGLGGKKSAGLPLYGAHEVGGARNGCIVVEGEKARDALHPIARENGWAVVGTVIGAPHVPNDAPLADLPDVPIYLWPDTDDVGHGQMRGIADALQRMGRKVAWLGDAEPRPGKGKDAADWVAQGGTAAALRALIENAAPLAADVTDVTDVTDPRETKAAPEPLPDGDSLLSEIETFTARYIAYPCQHSRIAHALWLAHAHMMDAWESTPRIAFLSPEPASGKSRALEVSELLVPNPIQAINVTPAYLFRKVDSPEGRPTILFDEVDTVFGPKAREHEEVRGLLNAGHRKGAVAGRCIVRGKAIETVDYPAYCAVALAGLGDLPDTILTRSIIVRMRRRAPHEAVSPFRRRLAEQEGHALRDRLATWAAAIAPAIGNPWPQLPDGVEDRDADVWEALIAVADAAGGAWPERAREAAAALVAASKESTPSLGMQLLADIRTVFDDGNRNQMQANSLADALCDLEEAPWAEIAGGKPLNPRGLAKRLKAYGITSKPVRAGLTVERGYKREDFADAWSRYLPAAFVSLGSVTSVTSVTPAPTPANETDADPAVVALAKELAALPHDAYLTRLFAISDLSDDDPDSARQLEALSLAEVMRSERNAQ